MSQAELAAAAGTTRSQINRLEHGDRRLSLEWMARLARALDVKLSELLPPESARASAAASPEEEILRITSQLSRKDALMLLGIAREILQRSQEEGAAPEPPSGKRPAKGRVRRG